MTETLANGYSFETTQPELFNEYQHDSYQKSVHPCSKAASALEGLNHMAVSRIRYRAPGLTCN